MVLSLAHLPIVVNLSWFKDLYYIQASRSNPNFEMVPCSVKCLLQYRKKNGFLYPLNIWRRITFQYSFILTMIKSLLRSIIICEPVPVQKEATAIADHKVNAVVCLNWFPLCSVHICLEIKATTPNVSLKLSPSIFYPLAASLQVSLIQHEPGLSMSRSNGAIPMHEMFLEASY